LPGRGVELAKQTVDGSKRRVADGSDLQPGPDLLRRTPREGEVRFRLVEHEMK